MNLLELPKGQYSAPNQPREQKNLYGQNAAIRFFDSQDRQDMSRLYSILQGKGAQEFMLEVTEMTEGDVITWVEEESTAKKKDTVIFAVAPSERKSHGKKNSGEVHGFVYLYRGNEEIERFQRMKASGILTSQESQTSIVFEIGAAAIPNKKGRQENSGLMSSGIRQACVEIDRLQHEGKDDGGQFPQMVIFAFIEPNNILSQRAFERAGFVYRGDLSYKESDATEESDKVYVLDWNVLNERLHESSESMRLGQRE